MVLDIYKQRRLDALATLVDSLHLDAILLMTPLNLFYFAGFRTSLYTRFNGLLVRKDGSMLFITSYIDERLAKDEVSDNVWIHDIRIYGPFGRPEVTKTYQNILKPELFAAHQLGVDAITLTQFFELKAAFPDLLIKEITTNLMPIRRCKDPDEVENIRRASQIGIACMQRAREIIACPKLTQIDLGAELEFQSRRLGADGVGYPVLISAGEKITAPHAPLLRSPIGNAPFVRIALAPTYNGYCSSIIRTFCREPVSQLTMYFESTFFTALRNLEGTIKEDITVGEILAIVARIYTDHEVRDAWSGDVGYGLGIAPQEPPVIGGQDETPIEAGMVLALKPGLRRPGGATFHHSDVYFVKDDRCDLLSPGLQEVVLY